MKLRVQLVILLAAAMAAAQNAATVTKPVDVSKVVIEALTARGFTAEELPTTWDLSALPAALSPDLRVEQVSWDWLRGLIQIRLQCAPQSPCMPLLIQGRVAPQAEASVRAKLTEGRAHSGNTTARRPRQEGRAAILVQAGKPAILFWQRDRLRVSTPVTCLRNGRNGDEVPVRTREGKRLLKAQVVGVGTVAVF